VRRHSVSIMACSGGTCGYADKKLRGESLRRNFGFAAQYLTKQLTESKTRMCLAWCSCVAGHSSLIY